YALPSLHQNLHEGIHFFFSSLTGTTPIYTLSLHDALPICPPRRRRRSRCWRCGGGSCDGAWYTRPWCYHLASKGGQYHARRAHSWTCAGRRRALEVARQGEWPLAASRA